MCKTWTLSYSCTHIRTVRLSTCRGTVTYQTDDDDIRKREPKAACASKPTLSFCIPTACGECERLKVEQQLKKPIDDLRARIAEWDDPERLAVETEHNARLHRLNRQFPKAQFKKYLRPEKGRRTTELVALSPLKNEVVPDDIEASEEDEEWRASWSTPSYAEEGVGEEQQSEWQPDTSWGCEDSSADSDYGWAVPDSTFTGRAWKSDHPIDNHEDTEEPESPVSAVATSSWTTFAPPPIEAWRQEFDVIATSHNERPSIDEHNQVTVAPPTPTKKENTAVEFINMADEPRVVPPHKRSQSPSRNIPLKLSIAAGEPKQNAGKQIDLPASSLWYCSNLHQLQYITVSP